MIIIFDDIALARHNKQVYYALALCNVHVFRIITMNSHCQAMYYLKNYWRLLIEKNEKGICFLFD